LRLIVSLNSRLESNKEEEKNLEGVVADAARAGVAVAIAVEG